jgi:hypothetical protein
MKNLLQGIVLVALTTAFITVITVPCASGQSLAGYLSQHVVVQSTSVNKLGPQPEPPDSSLGTGMPAMSQTVRFHGGVRSFSTSAQWVVIRANNRSHAMGTPMPIPPSVRGRYGKR